MSTDLIARTGRVQSWIDDPKGRLPVSCTVINVSNEMEGPDGIEASWRFASHALRNGAGVAIHLSELDPRGFERDSGVIASGPVSFGRIYSALNETLRRGGKYKNGAIVLHIDARHDDLIEFIETPRDVLPWVKRCVNITQEWWDEASQEKKDALLKGIKKGDIWLNKVRYDSNGNRIFGNVCLEVYLPSRGTCLLQHISLGACTVGTIPSAFIAGMSELCSLHSKTGVGQSGEYLSPEVDRQVGLGMLGLANLLRRYGVSYKDFGLALESLVTGDSESREWPAWDIAVSLKKGIEAAAEIAKSYNMVRAFAIAPTASCSYRYKDLDGYTTCPEIAPPISTEVDRDSGTFGVEHFDYGPCEIASEVGWEAYRMVADNIMILLNNTGLMHGYSMNSWSDVVTYDQSFIEEWLASPQTSLYYSLQVMPDTQDKSNAMAALEDLDVEKFWAEAATNNAPDCDCAE